MAQQTPSQTPGGPSRCFICLGDAGEEGDISDWVHPCPCSLEAHHACLLQWVDECEREGKALKCPVCQTPIRVEGAHDLAVELSDGIRRFVNGFSPVVVGSMMGGAVVAGQALYGFHSVRVFAGEEAVLSVLGSGRLRESLPGLLGVPLIAPGLVFWQLFPGFTATISTPFSILYSATFFRSPETLAWPPTPQLAFASLPCIAMAYIKIKNEILGGLEAKWDRIIRGLPEADSAEQPPQGAVGGIREIINNIADGLQGDPGEQADNEGVEIWWDEGEGQGGAGLVIDVVEEIEDEDEEWQEPNEGDMVAPRAGLLPEDDGAHEERHQEERHQEAAEEPQPEPQGQPQDLFEEPLPEPQPAPAQQEPQRRPLAADRAVRYSIRDLTSTILGALLLPSVSWAAGELLRLALPKAWTVMPGPSRPFIFTPSVRLGPSGLLQERWGRSLVGGCAWVVLKDMFRLYVKYRRASIRPLRRVPNVKPRTQRS